MPPSQGISATQAGKIMASMFWDTERVSHVYFLPHGVTVNGQYYNNLLTMLCGK
jgi:hypothetical protein